MKIIYKDRICIRVRIEGVFKGVKFIYEDPINAIEGSQYIWVNEEDEDKKNSSYWWREGNMGCDCNRYQYLPKHMKELTEQKCGHEITINRIIPLEGENLTTLYVDFEYRGEEFEQLGQGFIYDSIAFPQFEMLTDYIDGKLVKKNNG